MVLFIISITKGIFWLYVAKQRIVPFDPLDDVPLPKGFPDSPPPKPSGSLDNLDGSGKYLNHLSCDICGIELIFFRSFVN